LSWKIACPTLVKDTFQVSCRVNETLFSRPRGFCHSKWQPKLQSTELRSCVQKGLFYPRQAGRQKVGGTITLLLFHDCTCTTLTPRHHHHTPRQTTASPRGTHHRYHNHTATPPQLTPPPLARHPPRRTLTTRPPTTTVRNTLLFLPPLSDQRRGLPLCSHPRGRDPCPRCTPLVAASALASQRRPPKSARLGCTKVPAPSTPGVLLAQLSPIDL